MRTWKKAILTASMVALAGTHAPAPALADSSSQDTTTCTTNCDTEASSGSSESSSETGEKIGYSILGIAFVIFAIWTIGNADRRGSCAMKEDACEYL